MLYSGCGWVVGYPSLTADRLAVRGESLDSLVKFLA